MARQLLVVMLAGAYGVDSSCDMALQPVSVPGPPATPQRPTTAWCRAECARRLAHGSATSAPSKPGAPARPGEWGKGTVGTGWVVACCVGAVCLPAPGVALSLLLLLARPLHRPWCVQQGLTPCNTATRQRVSKCVLRVGMCFAASPAVRLWGSAGVACAAVLFVHAPLLIRTSLHCACCIVCRPGCCAPLEGGGWRPQ